MQVSSTTTPGSAICKDMTCMEQSTLDSVEKAILNRIRNCESDEEFLERTIETLFIATETLSLENLPDFILERFFNCCPKAMRLSLSNSSFSDDDIRVLIKHFPKLEELEMNGSSLTELGFHEINKWQKLRKLSLYHCERLSSRHLSKLFVLPNLRELTLDGFPLEVEGIQHLVKHFPHLELLSAQGYKLQDADLKLLAHLPRLKRLRLMGLQHITEEGALSCQAFSQLEEVELSGSKAMTSFPYRYSTIYQLRDQWELSPRAKKVALFLLECHPTLRSITLNTRGFPLRFKAPNHSELLQSFERFPQSKKANRWCIQANHLTDLSFIYLVDHFKEIESLVLLSAKNISDAALPHLDKLPKLVRFEMYGAALVSESAKDLLQKQLPNLTCSITHQPLSRL